MQTNKNALQYEKVCRHPSGLRVSAGKQNFLQNDKERRHPSGLRVSGGLNLMTLLF